MSMSIKRRLLIKLAALGLVSTSMPSVAAAVASPSKTGINLKAIPASGEAIPVIGMGTWRTFNIGRDEQLLEQRKNIVDAFFKHGGGLIDSSPMYGSAPDVMGHALQRLDEPASFFSAEKVWSPAGGDTLAQFRELADRWTLNSFDLMQIHNLRDWQEHLEVLRELKDEGKIRYIGITTSHGRRHREFEQILATEDIDFAQLTYNITHREVEDRLLPAAREHGVAVIANRPYDGGYLIKNMKRSHEVPAWAQDEFSCETWADFLLKFIVSHPAVTCAIPATSQLSHLKENMLAGVGAMPSAATREKMIAHVRSL